MAVTFPTDLGGNGLTYDNESFALGGHRVNFIPVLEQVVVMAESTSNNSVLASDAKDLAIQSSEAADISESNALLFRNQAETFSNSAGSSAIQAGNSANSAATSLTGTLAAAGLSGAKAYSSFASASADFANLINNQVVFIVTDETRSNQGSYYRANGTPVSTLVFLRAHEYYTSPVPYIQSDSVQNMITKLLVASGLIPQNPAAIDANFADPAYL